MIRIAGIWELGYNTPLIELDQWQYPLRDFAVDEFYMTPVTGIRSTAVTEVHDLDILLGEMRDNGVQVVFVDESGATELSDFIHPENVIYVFGIANLSPFKAYKKETDLSVYIKTPSSSGLLWPHQCAVTLLYDRINKWQS